jgi:aminoglycoside phosphotransferase (APT) family kinase protein
MLENPWDADRSLTAGLALQIIQNQFPDLGAGRILFLGAGWDNDAYLVDDAWVFRFPRRRDVAATIEREIAVTAAAGAALQPLQVAVPEIRFVGKPSAAFPYAFAGYRYLPGISAGERRDTVATTKQLARELGAILSRVHAIQPERLAPVSLGRDDNGPAAWLRDADDYIPDLLAWETDDIAACAAWVADVAVAPADYAGNPRLLHDDLGPDHLLLEPRTGHIRGLLDWADAIWGDPVLDFMTLPAWLGWECLPELLAAYELPLDPGFMDRLRFMSRVMALEWLHDAHRMGGDLAKHRRWTRRAFADPGSE